MTLVKSVVIYIYNYNFMVNVYLKKATVQTIFIRFRDKALPNLDLLNYDFLVTFHSYFKKLENSLRKYTTV